MRYRPKARLYFFIWIIACLALGWCGSQEPDGQLVHGVTTFTLIDYDVNSVTWLSRIGAAYYFVWFLIITPLLGLRETPLPVPDSLFTPVLPAAAGAVAAPAIGD
jgi:ubiquinol-cytochrome c reductase cytochrome b subunit